MRPDRPAFFGLDQVRGRFCHGLFLRDSAYGNYKPPIFNIPSIKEQKLVMPSGPGASKIRLNSVDTLNIASSYRPIWSNLN